MPTLDHNLPGQPLNISETGDNYCNVNKELPLSMTSPITVQLAMFRCQFLLKALFLTCRFLYANSIFSTRVLESALSDDGLTALPDEAVGTRAVIAINEIRAGSSEITWLTGTLVNIYLTVPPRKSWNGRKKDQYKGS